MWRGCMEDPAIRSRLDITYFPRRRRTLLRLSCCVFGPKPFAIIITAKAAHSHERSIAKPHSCTNLTRFWLAFHLGTEARSHGAPY